MHLNATQLEFLGRLGKSPDGQQLQVLLKAEIDDVNEKLRTFTGEHLLRAQGRAVLLDELADRLSMPLTKLNRDMPRRAFHSPPDVLA
jgi:hypothetical protein